MDRTGKTNVIDEMKSAFEDVVSVVVADYRGLDVPTITEIREEFTKAGCGYKVVKNTLLKIAIKDTEVEPLSTYLSGPTAVMWSTESPSVPAKIAVKFAKEQKEFSVCGGFALGEGALDAVGVERLSKMPGKPELQASLLMTFMAAPTDFVRQLAAAPQNFVYLIDARRRQLEE